MVMLKSPQFISAVLASSIFRGAGPADSGLGGSSLEPCCCQPWQGPLMAAQEEILRISEAFLKLCASVKADAGWLN